MKWKIQDNQPKLSVSSNNSMSFLTDDNLTFHRFGTTSDGSMHSNNISINVNNNNINNQQMHISNDIDNTSENRKNINNNNKISIWTTKSSHNNYTSETDNEFQYIPTTALASVALNKTTMAETSTSTLPKSRANDTLNKKSLQQNGSTTKLVINDDQTTKQSKCSIFRGIILCLCLNMTYANVVRFPRELERHGSGFLVPYFILLLFIGLPIVLLEMSLGQFLGQGSAHTWKASPFFKGASILSRIASCLCSLWISMQAAIAVLYLGMLTWKALPFRQCAHLKIETSGYKTIGQSGQECIKHTFLTPVWENTLYFGLLSLALIGLWIISTIFTHSSKINRRSILIFGLGAMILLFFETGWEITKIINKNYFPILWPFDYNILKNSTIWFNALVQVIFSTNIGFGALPVITGKYLYKGDAVRTSFIYIFFNIFVNIIGVTYFLTQYNNTITKNATVLYPELTPLTTIYDNALASDLDPLLSRLIPGLSYLLIIFTAIISIIICIYTTSRLFSKHPTYSLCLIAIILCICSLLSPDYLVANLLDTRIIGTVAICALIFDIVGIIWIYGAKNIYTDLEFSIGRPIYKIWVFLWIIAPLLLSGILIWWSIMYVPTEILITYIPRWGPIAACVIIVSVLACVEVGKQVDYNFVSMIKEATKSSKEWGPADPLARHAWKQWRSVCEDTGQRDFTLRRRGTRDYTNSIKKGQYLHAKYGTNRSTPGSNSPNYSGSVFGDSAIEEDISVDKYQNYSKTQLAVYSNDSTKGSNSSGRSNKLSGSEKMHENIYDRSKVARKPTDENYTSRIEITPKDETDYRISLVRNPMARIDTNPNYRNSYSDKYGSFQRDIYVTNASDDHLCWRKYSGNSEEFSTEL